MCYCCDWTCADRNYSVSMMLAVQPTHEFVSIPHNVTYLTGIIAGSEIGLHGNLSSFVYSHCITSLPVVLRNAVRHVCEPFWIHITHSLLADSVSEPVKPIEVIDGFSKDAISQKLKLLNCFRKIFEDLCVKWMILKAFQNFFSIFAICFLFSPLRSWALPADSS